MIVVADTSPVNYLTLIGETDLLRQLYSEVLIPLAVNNELLSPDSPPPVCQFVARPPRWLSVVAPGSNSDPRLAELDEGEREAIVLALNHGADLLFIDERDGRRVALVCGVEAAGTLRVLANGAERGLVDLEDAFNRLRKTSFRAAPGLMESLLIERTRGMP